MKILAICIGLGACLLLWMTQSLAFHKGQTPSCADGETGYLAMVLAEGGQVFTFLSAQDPANADTILCQIMPGQLVQTKTKQKGL